MVLRCWNVRSVGYRTSHSSIDDVQGGTRGVPLLPFVTLARVRHTPPPVVAMNEIMNHGYVAPPRARPATVADLPRESDERPYIVGELTGEFDPFNDFPMPRKCMDYANHPAKRSELDRGLAPPLEDVGGHEIVGHHIARLRDHEPAAAGVPNYPPPRGTAPAAWQPAPSPGLDDHHPAPSSAWQTTAQAQMSGQAAAPRRRSGKRMVPPPGAPTGSLMARGADASFGASEHAYGRVGFGPKPAPLAPRADVLHRNVDPRGGCGTETLPFVPGYGGHVPETRVNFGEAARRGLAPRAPKDLLVENFNPRMPGCTKGSGPRRF